MKKIATLFIICLLAYSINAQNLKSFYDFKVQNIYGDSIDLNQFKGKKLLVVNTASYCGYTPQFTQMEELYTQYHQYNFEVIGFPCNDFGSQEPQSNVNIEKFCTDNYGVTFPMMSKIFIVKGDTAPVYKWLQRANLNGVQNAHVEWNFNKFLIDEQGHWVKHYLSPTLPTDTSITNWIMKSSTQTGISIYSNSDDLVGILSDNPTSSSINLIVKSISEEHLLIRLYTIDGKLIDKIYDGAAVNSQIINYPVSNLSKGIYLIKTECNNLRQTIKYSVL